MPKLGHLSRTPWFPLELAERTRRNARQTSYYISSFIMQGVGALALLEEKDLIPAFLGVKTAEGVVLQLPLLYQEETEVSGVKINVTMTESGMAMINTLSDATGCSMSRLLREGSRFRNAIHELVGSAWNYELFDRETNESYTILQ